MKKYKDRDGNNKTAVQAIKAFFGAPEAIGYPPVLMEELKELLPSNGGPGYDELGDGAAVELGWTPAAG